MSQKHEKRLIYAQEKEVIKSAKATRNAQDEKNLAEERLLAMDKYIHDLEESYEAKLSNAHQEFQKSVHELKHKREQMLQIQEITKTWNIEDG